MRKVKIINKNAEGVIIAVDEQQVTLTWPDFNRRFTIVEKTRGEFREDYVVKFEASKELLAQAAPLFRKHLNKETSEEQSEQIRSLLNKISKTSKCDLKCAAELVFYYTLLNSKPKRYKATKPKSAGTIGDLLTEEQKAIIMGINS